LLISFFYISDIIEELIAKRQQLDAVNFAYEAGLQEKFPPVPLLKSYLEDSKKTSSTIADDSSASNGQSGVCIITILKFFLDLKMLIELVVFCVCDVKLNIITPLNKLYSVFLFVCNPTASDIIMYLAEQCEQEGAISTASCYKVC
jgi:hypothetical protein